MLFKIVNMFSNIWSVSQLCYSYNEVRDYVGIRLSQFVINGINPYSLDINNTLTVPFLYQYTGLTPFLVGILCKLTGINIIAANYFFNFLFLLLTSYFFYLIYQDNFHSSCFRFLFFICIFFNTSTFFSMFGAVALTFRPDAIGLFICSIIFYLVKYRSIEHGYSLCSLFYLLSQSNL